MGQKLIIEQTRLQEARKILKKVKIWGHVHDYLKPSWVFETIYHKLLRGLRHKYILCWHSMAGREKIIAMMMVNIRLETIRYCLITREYSDAV